uniref:Uncharacterized protein n=1 Tax=Trichogramma kaykai TaxID=54128 RepID=A0ABD2XEW1_9HYME
MADINKRPNFEEWKTLRAKTNWKIKQERYDLLLKLDTLINDWNFVLPNLREIFRSEEIECLLLDSLDYWGGNAAKEKLAQRFIEFVARTGYRHEPQVDKHGKPQLHQTTPVHRVVRRDWSNRNIVRVLMKIYDLNYIDNYGLGHFHVACVYGLKDHSKKFLELGQYLNCVYPATGDSPLHLVMANKDNERLLELLLRHGAEPGSINRRTGATPLHDICKRANNGAAKAVQLLFDVADGLRRPVRVNAPDKWSDTPLHLALMYRSRDAVGLLLSRGADPNLANAAGSTALHLVCKRHDRQLLRTILESSDDEYRPVHVDAKDKNGDAPLHLALRHQKYDLVEALLEAGADANLANNEGTTPLHVVCQIRYGQSYCGDDFLISCDKYNRPLEINAQDQLGNTPLHLSLDNRHASVAYSLLENDADPNLANKKGMTPLHSAFMKIYIDSNLIALMLRKDADPNLADEQGMTPLHLAVKKKDQDLIGMMLRRGGNLNLTNEKGMTPFHFALEENNEGLIAMLLRKGCDPNLANEEGMTSLHLLCSSRERDRESADMLLELGGNDEHRPLRIDARDKKGRTPLELAVANFLPLTVEAILELGADVSNFDFPAESCFAEGVPWLSSESRSMSKLRLAASAMAIVESLEKRGYELHRSDALRIMKFFARKQLFENSSGPDKPWDDELDYASKAKGILIKISDPSVSLNDLIPLQTREVVKRLTVLESKRNFYRYSYESPFYFKKREDVFIMHLCEKMSRKFFREWALDPIVLLIHYRLPAICCEMILKNLTNRELYNICLADPSLS